jgi:hypothetical protein
MDRYELKIYLHDKKKDPFGMGTEPDLVVSLKAKAEVSGWIDHDPSIRKATLLDRTNNNFSILINK